MKGLSQQEPTTGFSGSALSGYLQRRPALLKLWAISAAFSTYFCMYAFRKPFTVGTFDGSWGEFSLKTLFIISQILGYALSKYVGTVVVSSLAANQRLRALLALVGIAWVALLVFALGTTLLRVLALFVNGLCLGMIWGLVVGFLEGRRSSELLLAGLSCSFILASGVVKDVARYLMRAFDTPETWMPFLTGALFMPPLLISAGMLSALPPPSKEDERERSRRTPMNGRERASFFRRFAGPLLLLLMSYFLLTAFRDYRDNYGIDLFNALGYNDQPALFTITELPVAFFVLLILALLSLVRDNQRALAWVFGLMSAGLFLLSVSTWLLQIEAISGLVWMFLLGLGSYLCYVPFGSVLFDRMVAHTRAAGNAAFGIYLADSIGYTGSILVQLYAELLAGTGDRLGFFLPYCHVVGLGGGAILLTAGTLLLRSRPLAQPV